jgi:head-tail adaptor
MNLPHIGELKERIDILNVSAPYSTEMKGLVVSVAVSGLWAKIEPLGGSVDVENMQVQTCAQEYRIWIRCREGLTPWQQIQWGSKQLAITGPIENMEKRFLLIHAQERTSRSL